MYARKVSGSATPSTPRRAAPPSRAVDQRSQVVVLENNLQTSATWTAVDSPEGRYWWNESTNEVTVVGAPQPMYPTLAEEHQAQQPQQPSFGKTMIFYMLAGVGVSLGFMLVGSVFSYMEPGLALPASEVISFGDVQSVDDQSIQQQQQQRTGSTKQ